ncbi:MAG: acyl carrier protein [Opitutales bacterium]|nr:acyl carrier protein [Opitutales bacterium]
MSDAPIEEFIAELEASITAAQPGEIQPETLFRACPWWDSLAVLCTLGAFDICFGRQIQADDLRRCKTIQDIYDLSRQEGAS